MKRNVYLAAALLAGLAACDNEPSFRVEGTVTGSADKMLYFEHSGLEGVTCLDSTRLNDNGTFQFSQARPESPEFYRLRVEDKVIHFSVDSTETVRISARYDQFGTGYQIESSESNRKIQELTRLQANLQTQVNKVSASGLPAGIARDSLQALIRRYKDEVKRNYIFVEPNKAYAYFALFQQLNGYMIFDPLNNKDDVKCFAAVATSLNNLYPHADRSRNLYNMVIKGMKNTRTPQVKEVSLPTDIVRETTIIDIPLMDIKGETRHLTDLKGKVVLIDFTAYQNTLSGAHNLLLRELYNKYAAQGFEIYQISIDADEHFWKTASDNLPWICVRDPQGPYSSYLNIYGVTQLPALFLVNRANELSARLGEKDNLEAAIQKLL
ncbi:MAG: thioredoxin-like domain-containing protein [Bacteroidales bacterium]|nr:thioredoxin-like domain-containing protein [Bacteroidales bacterium]